MAEKINWNAFHKQVVLGEQPPLWQRVDVEAWKERMRNLSSHPFVSKVREPVIGFGKAAGARVGAMPGVGPIAQKGAEIGKSALKNWWDNVDPRKLKDKDTAWRIGAGVAVAETAVILVLFPGAIAVKGVINGIALQAGYIGSRGYFNAEKIYWEKRRRLSGAALEAKLKSIEENKTKREVQIKNFAKGVSGMAVYTGGTAAIVGGVIEAVGFDFSNLPKVSLPEIKPPQFTLPRVEFRLPQFRLPSLFGNNSEAPTAGPTPVSTEELSTDVSPIVPESTPTSDIAPSETPTSTVTATPTPTEIAESATIDTPTPTATPTAIPQARPTLEAAAQPTPAPTLYPAGEIQDPTGAILPDGGIPPAPAESPIISRPSIPAPETRVPAITAPPASAPVVEAPYVEVKVGITSKMSKFLTEHPKDVVEYTVKPGETAGHLLIKMGFPPTWDMGDAQAFAALKALNPDTFSDLAHASGLSTPEFEELLSRIESGDKTAYNELIKKMGRIQSGAKIKLLSPSALKQFLLSK